MGSAGVAEAWAASQLTLALLQSLFGRRDEPCGANAASGEHTLLVVYKRTNDPLAAEHSQRASAQANRRAVALETRYSAGFAQSSGRKTVVARDGAERQG